MSIRHKENENSHKEVARSQDERLREEEKCSEIEKNVISVIKIIMANK